MKRLCDLALLAALLGLAVSGCTKSSTDNKTEAMTVLVEGSPIHGANGIIFDSEDRLLIASVFGREIVVMDRENGSILARLGPELGIEGPEDLALGPEGSLYWTSVVTGEVGRLSPDSVKKSQKLATGVNPITFSGDGRLFAALDFSGDALYELDPELDNPPRLIAENLGWLNGMDWGPDGFLYGPVWSPGQVVRIDVDKGRITPVAEGFVNPSAVKFDSHGRLYMVTSLTGEILQVDTETGGKKLLAQVVPGLDNLAFDSQDGLFVSHSQDGSIFEVLPSGIKRTVSRGGMIVPGGVAVLPRPGGESVFVADLWTLREFNGLTGKERSVTRNKVNSGLPGITTPQTVSPDGSRLVLSSWLSGEVQVWNPETFEVVEDYRDFAMPLNAIRFQGDLIVAELGTSSVVRASAAEPEDRVTLAAGLDIPVGLAATDDGLWVSEWGSGTVLQIVSGGKRLAEPVPVAKNLVFPEGLAVAQDGSLLVVETGTRRLLRIDTETGEISTVADKLDLGAQAIPGTPPTWIFNGVAVGRSGAIYVTGDIANVLYRLVLRI
ncbi:MAG TPA: hypothetical protein VM123_10475 [archaeon]|nr:hypothetical protein [archaeon]